MPATLRASHRTALATLALGGTTVLFGACVAGTNPLAPTDDGGPGLGDDAALADTAPSTADGSVDSAPSTDASPVDSTTPADTSTPAEDAPSTVGDASTDANDAGTGLDASDGSSTSLDSGLTPFPITLESVAVGGDPNASIYMTNVPAAPLLSNDGRYVLFYTQSTNMAGSLSATSNVNRVFVRDTVAGTQQEVSLLADGGENQDPFYTSMAISGDGRYVVFSSLSQYWDPSIPANQGIWIRWDRTTGHTSLIGVTPDGGAYYSGTSPALSSDGRYMAFITSLPPIALPPGSGSQILVRDFQAPGDGITIASATDGPLDAGPDAGDAQVGVPEGTSQGVGNTNNFASISSDGTVVAFDSSSYNMQPGSLDAGVYVGNRHCFIRNLVTQHTEMVDVQMAGAATHFPDGECDDPVLSGNGRYVVFFSDATNLVPGDTNGTGDVFLRDLQLGTTTRLTTTAAGAQIATLAVLYPDYGISSDGSYVVLGDHSHLMAAGDTSTGNRTTVVLDRVHGTRAIASYNADGSSMQSPQDTGFQALSADGTFITYVGSGAPFVPSIQTSNYVVYGVARSAAR